MIDAALVALGALLTVAGLVGCVLPVLPGPPLSWLGLLLLSIAQDWSPYGGRFLLLLAVVAVVVTVLDYVVPGWGAKKAGASRAGVWASVLGMLAGMIWFPPFGMILGSFVGAVLGELLVGRSGGASLKAAWGVFVGTIAGIILKLTASGVMTYYFVAGLLPE